MQLQFYKYQGTGNDFIMVDNRGLQMPRLNPNLYKRLCHRRFGIGADGLIMVQNLDGYDFEMVYFNSDGNESSMCGNGGRCIVKFAHQLGIIGHHAHFLAVDGPHDAEILDNGWVTLRMKDVEGVEQVGEDYYLNTGSPHYVAFSDSDVADIELVAEARKIRYNDRFAKEGTNVNYVQLADELANVRTYERGVEDETYSCGTGVTAVALVAGLSKTDGTYTQAIKTPGGNLKVAFDKQGGSFKNIWLQGPADFVYSGVIEV